MRVNGKEEIVALIEKLKDRTGQVLPWSLTIKVECKWNDSSGLYLDQVLLGMLSNGGTAI